MKKHRRFLIVTLGVSAVAQSLWPAEWWAGDVDLAEHFRDTAVVGPACQRYERVFRASERRANFTFFSGVDNVRVEDGLAGKGDTNWRINVGRAMRDGVLPASAWSAASNWHTTERCGDQALRNHIPTERDSPAIRWADMLPRSGMPSHSDGRRRPSAPRQRPLVLRRDYEWSSH